MNGRRNLSDRLAYSKEKFRASPITARLSNSNRASKVWFTFRKCRGQSVSNIRKISFKRGDEVEVQVLDIDTGRPPHQFGDETTAAESVGNCRQIASRSATKCADKVRNLTDFGAFIEIEDGIDGLVHVSDISLVEKDQTSERRAETRSGCGSGNYRH